MALNGALLTEITCYDRAPESTEHQDNLYFILSPK